MHLFIALIFIHVLLFLSIFEIYFKSPIIDNIPLSKKASGVQLAKRVVIFFADGVRAEKFYEVSNGNYSNAPYLRTLLENNGACGGIAHTQVPTETRPGAIAMLAGFYEDPSAIFKGWQDNPIEFDHIFNQSKYSVAFGSPDVLKMFARGFTQRGEERFHFEFYNENEQQFKNEKQLNYWVGNRTLQYLSINKDLSSLKQDQVIFMLHFLGPDTAGHNYKPNSKEYADNILIVDRIVQAVVKYISNYYNNDNQTAFIYGSDHGMTDWGSHGDGSDHETETPFVAWGAGVGCTAFPSSTSPTSLTFLPRSHGQLDIAQVDIVSLVSTLLGVPIPVHSVGRLPLQYLALDKHQQARVIHSNAIQIHNAYSTLRSQRKGSIADVLFTPFHKLTENEEAVFFSHIELGFKLQDFDSVISNCNELMKLSLEGLAYFHTYHQTHLLVCVSVAYLGLLKLLLTSAWNLTKISHFNLSVCRRHIVVAIGVMLAYCYNLGLPLQSYVFALLPIFTWFSPVSPSDLPETLKFNIDYMAMFLQTCFYVCGILMLVCTFFHRWILSILLLCIAGFEYYRPRSGVIDDVSTRNCILSLIPLSLFPLLPIAGTQDTNKYLLILTGIAWFLFRIYSAESSGPVMKLQLIILGVTVAHISLWSTVEPYWAQLLISWFILMSSPLTIFLSPKEPEDRLMAMASALAPPFILLCTSYEVFFLLFLFLHLMCWFRLESKTSDLRCDLMHQAFLILVLLFLCFFGLGNIASVSSYDWNCVRFFITVFSPFTMLSFVLLKVFIPFLCVSCAVRAIHIARDVAVPGYPHWRYDGTPSQAEIVLQLVLAFCDMMALVFLYLVRNTGSWKQIGLSISHVVIVHSITLALMCLYGVASYIVPTRKAKSRYC